MGSREEFEWLTLPKSEAQVLGTISHKIAEEIDEGRFDQVPDADLEQTVLERWNHLAGIAMEELKSHSIFGDPAPPRRWPFFVVKQSAALDRARLRRDKRGEGNGKKRPDVEVALQSDTLRLSGRIDRIEYLGQRIRLVDVKTAANSGGSIPRAYRFQLLLYAAMWEERTGKLPGFVAIEWQDGSRSSETVSISEIEEVCKSLTASRLQLELPVPPDGTPAEEVCCNCSYRTLCRKFQEVERLSWVWQPSYVVGLVEHVVDSANERSLIIRPESSQPHGIPIAVVHKFPVAVSVEAGDHVIFDRLAWRGGEGNFDALWNSRFKNLRGVNPESVVVSRQGESEA